MIRYYNNLILKLEVIVDSWWVIEKFDIELDVELIVGE